MSFGRAARMTGRMAGRTVRPAGLAVVLLALAACGGSGSPLEALGVRVPPPDEFQVMAHQPPVIPESYTLPEPRPGARSPRDPDPERAAIAALLGPEAAARAAAVEPSPGEQALLGAADAGAASSDIRVQLEEDKRQAAASESYEPPLLWELLGLTSSDELEGVDESEIIDPLVEAERLQGEGVATPVDPDAAERVAADEDEPEREVESFDRRPTERLGPPPEPAY